MTLHVVVSMLTVVVLVSGEVQYARNGHHVSTLMHVDTSLPLWAFLDIYGTMKEIKSIGKSACLTHQTSVVVSFQVWLNKINRYTGHLFNPISTTF